MSKKPISLDDVVYRGKKGKTVADLLNVLKELAEYALSLTKKSAGK